MASSKTRLERPSGQDAHSSDQFNNQRENNWPRNTPRIISLKKICQQLYNIMLLWPLLQNVRQLVGVVCDWMPLIVNDLGHRSAALNEWTVFRRMIHENSHQLCSKCVCLWILEISSATRQFVLFHLPHLSLRVCLYGKSNLLLTTISSDKLELCDWANKNLATKLKQTESDFVNCMRLDSYAVR